MKAFISYSHVDAAVVGRLKVHLRQMERGKLISVFYDREIRAGQHLDDVISENLEEAGLFLAVVSPDFLNSNYCYEREMKRALELHDEGRMIVVPIIAEPCDWKNSPLGQLKAVPQDGKSISEWQNANSAFMDIVGELRRLVVPESGNFSSAMAEEKLPSPKSQASRFRVKRTFDAVDRINFRENAFAAIAEYFDKGISELSSVQGLRAVFRKVGPYTFTATLVNQGFDKRGVAHITVHMGTDRGSLGDVFWSDSENAPTTSANGFWTIAADDYDQYLTGGSFMMSGQEKKLTPYQAAEQMWTDFMGRAGVAYG